MDENGGAAGRFANFDCGTRMIAVAREANSGVVLGVMAAQRVGAGLDATVASFPDRAVVAGAFPLDSHAGQTHYGLTIDKGLIRPDRASIGL